MPTFDSFSSIDSPELPKSQNLKAFPVFSEFPELLELLKTWTSRRWIRPLDYAFALFLKKQGPRASFLVLLGAVLVSHQLGRGHICLDLARLLADPDAAVCLPPEDEEGKEMPPTPSQILSHITKEIWEKSLLASPLVGQQLGNTPLALISGRLYLRRYWVYTLQVAEQIHFRVGEKFSLPQDLEKRLDRLFMGLRSSGEDEKTQIHWQSIAAAIAAKGGFSIISGGPGTGKTTTVVQLLGLLQGLSMEEGRALRICLAAPTGKAAARLTESIGKAIDRLPETVRKKMPTTVSTLHRLLGSRSDSRNFIHNINNPIHVDLLVVDEASMIDLEMMNALLQAIPPKARLILLGDKDQLASVEAGSVLGDLCANAANPSYRPETVAWLQKFTGFELSDFSGMGRDLDQHIVVLRKSHRFGEQSGIGALARAVNQGDEKEVAHVWNQGFSDIFNVRIKNCRDDRFRGLVLDGNPGSRVDPHGSSPMAAGSVGEGYRAYLETMAKGPRAFESESTWLLAVLDQFNKFQVLTPLRKGDWGVEVLNSNIANILHGSNLIPATQGWYPGRPVLITRNDYSLGLMNGDMGIVYSTSQGLRVVFPMSDGSLKRVLPSRLSHVETVYAMTVHKSQGSEFDHTAMVLPNAVSPVITRELVYTGITRAKNWFTLVSPHETILASAIGQRTQRDSGLGDLIV